MMKRYLIAFLLCVGIAVQANEQKPFSLLLVSSFFGGSYQALTGLDRYVVNYAQFLKAKNIPVTVLVQEGTAVKQVLKNSGIPCYSWAFRGKQKAGQGSFSSFMHRIVYEHQITHVHCNMLAELHAVYGAIKKHKLPLFYTHHYQYSFPIEKHKFLAGVCVVNKMLVEKLSVASACKRPIAGNRLLMQGIVSIKFIPPFLDDEQLCVEVPRSSVNEIPIITTVGNMYLDLNAKNYPLLIDAVDRLINHYHQPCKVLIVGGGPNKKTIEGLVAKKRLTDHIDFLGFRHDVPEILAASDVVVLTSKHEGFGMVLAEANMVGKPVIGPNGTGVEGVIEHDTNGLLFDNGNVDDFCKKCLQLLTNPSEREAMGKRGRQYAAEHFSNERVFEQMMQLYGLYSSTTDHLFHSPSR